MKVPTGISVVPFLSIFRESSKKYFPKYRDEILFIILSRALLQLFFLYLYLNSQSKIIRSIESRNSNKSHMQGAT